MASLPISSDVFDLFLTGDMIDIALNHRPSNQVLFVRMAKNGTVITSPSTICQTLNLVRIDLETIGGESRLLIVEKGSIRLARCLGSPEYWSISCPLVTDGTINGASMAVLADHLRIAYAIDDGNESTIFSLDCDMQGQVVRGPDAVSTPSLDAGSPVLLSTSSGAISCIYVEEHHDSQELFLKYDMDFVIPEIPRLKKFIESLDEDMLAEGNSSREKLIEKLDRVIAFLEKRNETAAVEEALALKESIEAYFVYAPYADLDAVQGPKNKIIKNLDTVKKDYSSGEVIVTSLPGGPTLPRIYVTSSVSSITSTSAKVTWAYRYSGSDSGYIMWGTSANALTNRIEGTRMVGETFTASINGLSISTQYFVSAHIVDGSSDYKTALPNFFTTYPNDLTITSIAVSTAPGSASITWTTNGASTSRIDYGTTTSYGSNVYSSSLVNTHSMTINNLGSNILYHYMITSEYSTTGFSLNAVTSDRTFTSATISGVTITSITSTLTDLNCVYITWTTDAYSTSEVQYGTTMSYGQTATGADGTNHAVDINGLPEDSLIHFRVISASVVNPGIYSCSSDQTFSTKHAFDADLESDAGDSSTTASLIEPGTYVGYLDSTFDTNDYYSTALLSGETIELVLDVPSNFNYNLFLFDPSGTQVASSVNGIGVDESIRCTIYINGVWKMRVLYQSGTGQGLYGFNVQLLGAWEHHYLDVGTAGDDDILAHTPGLAIMGETGWNDASSGMREAEVSGSFLLNIYDDTYQSITYYELAISYTSTAEVGVSLLVGDSWVSVATLPTRSIAWTYSFVLRSDMLSDSSSSIFGCNVRMRFDHAIIIDSIDAMPIAYSSDFFGGSQYNPGVMLENNWQIGSAVVNGSTYATLIVTLPRTEVTYFLEFQSLDSCHGVGVQQWDGSAYDNIGTLESWGTSAVVQLDPASYYDAQSASPGTNLRIRLSSPIINLSRVVLWISQVMTDVGTPGDSDANARLPGLSIIDNGEWGAMTTLDSHTVRNTVQGMSANFLLNGALSDTSYIISICYKATTGAASLYQYKGVGYGSYVSLGSLTVDGLWHTTLFKTSAENVYDYTVRGQTNMIFWISSTSSVAVDSITYCRDGDGDGYSDALESLRISQSGIGVHIHDLNPFSADTDSDGLNDNVETSPSYNTDPCDPDTDSDGLLDGSERYSYTWSTDDSYLIPDNAPALCIDLSLPEIPSASSSITSLCLVLGIMHPLQQQLEVKIAKGTGAQRTIKSASTGSGANYFILRNLFEAAAPFTTPYSASNLESGDTWHIYVRDAVAGTTGRVEYARLQVNGTTNPLDSDSDDDLLLDGEEVEFGTDGWMTNPRSSDSDSDGVSDRNEIIGSTPCGSATDPMRADTDDDGYADNVDRYMGDAVLRVTIMEYKTREDVNWGDDDCNIFFVIRYGDQELSTKRLYAYTDVLYYPGWAYDIDIAETATSVSLEFLVVGDNAVLTGDDEKLDVSPSGNLDHDVTWVLSSDPYILSFQGSKDTFDHDTDAYMKVKMERAVSEKAKVIVINGTGNDGDYGLDAVSTGVYRYSADDQMYMINLNVSGSSAHFQSGMNTIILPRAIALQCQLNDTLYDLQNISSSPLNGASFYSTNVSGASASGHIIAVIAKNVTTTQAELLLTMLTHNSTGGRVGNNVAISSTSLYLLHLPSDILSAIPTSVENAGMGEGPSFLDPLGTICDIANMVFDFLVWVATGGVLLLLAHLVKEGLKAISNLVSTAISVVEAAVDRIVDAFCAMVDWVVDLMVNFMETLFSPLIESIENAIESYVQGVNQAFSNAEQDVVAFGSVSSGTLNQLFTALTSDLFILMLGISISIQILLKTLTVLTMGASFLITVLVSVAVGYVVNEIIKSNHFDKFTEGICDGISGLYDWIEDNFGPGENPPSNVQIAWTAFGFCMSTVGAVYSLWSVLGNSFSASFGLTAGIISIILGTFATGLNSAGLGYLGIALGSLSAICSIFGISSSAELDQKIVGGISLTFGMMGITCSWESI
ncbi:MAG: hypothetical protein KBA58_01765 [Methanomassiliicoccales archaeon]|nr:hypothetical protein [Methanomassiliicoccales archaeon]